MESLPLTALDLVAIGILLLSAGLAFLRGFVHEVLSIAAWVGAAFAALYGLPLAQPEARTYISNHLAADIAAGVVLFLVSLLVLSLITGALARRVQSSSLNSLDRSLGFLFGLVRGAVIIALAFIVLEWFLPSSGPRPAWITMARGLPMMERGADVLRSLVPAGLLAEEDRARAVSREAQDQARKAMELKQTYDALTRPAPQAVPNPQPGAPASGLIPPPPRGQVVPGQVMPGQVVPGQAPGQTVPGQAPVGGVPYTPQDQNGLNQIIQRSQ